MTQKINTFGFPTEIICGEGSLERLPDALKRNAMKNPLVVTDEAVAKLPIFKALTKHLSKHGVYSDLSGNPIETHVVNGIEVYQSNKADSIIAFGGGAALDVAKAIAIMVHHPGNLFDYEDGKPGAKTFDKEVPPILAIPTTAGTGSEVGRSTVISDNKTHQKKVFFTPKMLPKAAILDPVLTLDLPPSVTAATGVDALTHNLEAFISAPYHPICDGIALNGIKMIARSLPVAVKDGKHICAREEMLLAACMGAIAFQKGLGATHSCAHALSTVFDVHHGLANALMLKAMMKFNHDVAADHFKTIEMVLQVKDFHQWLDGFLKEIGIPESLKAAGIDSSKMDALCDVAINDICHPLNPKPVTRDDFKNIFQEAMG